MKYYCIPLFFLLACTPKSDQPVNAENDSSYVQKRHVNSKPYKLLENEIVTVWGDTSVKDRIVNQVEVKFEPYLRFSDFPVNDIYKGKKAPLQLHRADTIFWSYRTRISEAYEEFVNFAGHYCFLYVGCGSPCQGSFLIDANTGEIYQGPHAALGYEYYKDSRMLIVNPPRKDNDTDGVYATKKHHYLSECAYCHPYIFIWNDTTKEFEERAPMY